MSKKKNSRSLKDLAWGVARLVLGSLGAFLLWSAYRQDANIERSGQRAEGHLTRKNAQIIYQSISYDIEYWFILPGGKRIEASRDVSESLWDKLKEGETFVVLYSADDPERNFPQGGGDASIWTLIGAVFCAFIALAGVLWFAFFIRPQTIDS